GLILSQCTSALAQNLESGIRFFTYERYQSAKQTLEPLAGSNPLANYYLGLSELGLEHTAEAKIIFQKYPDDAANNAGLARVLFSENKPEEALSMLNKVAARAKKKDWLPYKYAADAITYTEGGDPNVAIEWYKKALAVEASGDVYMAMGDAYRKMQGGGGNAMTNYEFAEEYANVKSMSNYKMGNLWYAAKNYDSALVKYNRSSELDAENPLPYKALADAYYKVSKYKISKEKIEKYLERTDKSITDLIEYANTLFLAQDYQNAILKLNELIQKGEGEKRPYMYRILGYSLYETKEYTGALQNMDKFFSKADPKKIIPSDYMYYGKILLTDSTKASQAGTWFDKSIALDTTRDKTPVYKQLAETYNKMSDYANAARYYQKILENSAAPGVTDFWWCGATHYYSKNYTSADSIYRIMNEKFPNEPSGFYMRGNVAFAGFDKESTNGAAVEYYSKWLGMIKTDDPDKKKNLIKVYTYLATVMYNTGKKDESRQYCTKLQALDPNDENAKNLLKALDAKK
ncbi:MAG TPA: hypothetical protein PLP34_05630, partial [Chitinophagaceae bacterium]|nr:hypothetical protein [Chitinophagaceae bacterium]